MPLQPARLRPWMMSLVRMLPSLALVQLMLLAFPPTMTSAQTPEAGNNIVAVVNADPITRKTLADATVERYGLDVLDSIINQQLILQACEQRGIKVTDSDVNQEVQRLANKFNLPMDAYLQLLKEERDITPYEYSAEIVWPTLALRRLVADKINVTQDEFNERFLARYGEAIKCRMIMVSDQQKARDLHSQAVANPKTFGQIAKQSSEDETSASVGGLIPPIRRHSGDTRLEAAVFALQDDQVSPVIQLGDQWIILQAVRRIPATSPSPDAIPLIREQIVDQIRDEKVASAASGLFQQLQAEAKVVKVIADPKLMEQYPGVAAVINGQQISISVLAEKCMRQHGDEVLKGEINRMLLAQALRKSKKQVTDDDIRAEVARAAVSYGFINTDGSADLQAWSESVLEDGKTTQELYLSDSVWPSVALQKLVEDEVQLTERDLKDGFESAYGPRVEVLAIVLSDQRSAQKIWKMARDNPTEEFFGQLAEQYSVEPVSSSNRGKVPPIRKHSGQSAIEKEAYRLQPGELSGIIVTGGKYILLRCQGFTEPVVTDPAVVREELVRDLTERKTRELMLAKLDQLTKAAEIDNYIEARDEAPRVASRPK